MIVTKSNVLSGVVPTITTGATLGTTDSPEDMTNPDFSLNYTSSDQSKLVAHFGSTTEINYVAVAGIKLKGSGDGLSNVRVADGDGSAFIKKSFITRDNVLVIQFDNQVFTDLKLTFLNNAADLPPTISYVAAGLTLEIPNGGEIAGHSRAWLNRSTKSKTATNKLSAPVATLRKPVALSGSLSLPNMTASFSQNEWQDFLDYAEDNLFFISEDSSKSESSYCCYDLSSATTKAHGQTRALNNLAIKFKVYNGL